METSLIEAMTIPLTHSSHCLSSLDIGTIRECCEGKRALVIGPGIGTAPETAELVRQLYRQLTIPLVVDADALNILAADPEVIKDAAGLRIFTPHPGELRRLIGWSTQQIQANRLEAARHACRTFNSDQSHNILVLKGAGTIICSPSRCTLINTSGNPGMATGGMGDVLSGVIGALICQGIAPEDAVSAAVYLHGAAADALYEKNGAGYTASEVADAVPMTLKTLLTFAS
jgi:NAD(P)H-hydrate epimerase